MERLQSAPSAIDQLKQLPGSSPQFEKWRRDAEVAISNTFRDKPQNVHDFTSIGYSLLLDSPSENQRFYVRILESAAAVIESMIDEIREYWEDDAPPHIRSQRWA